MQTAQGCCRLRSPASALFLIIAAFALIGGRAAAHSIAVDSSSTEPVEVFSGTILSVAIDNKVTGQSLVHHELRLDGGGALAVHGAAAASLQDGARVQLSARRSGNAIEALDAQVLAASASSSSNVEVHGALAIAHADDFATGRSRYAYEVHDDAGGVTILNLASLPAEIHSGARVRVTGQRSADGSS